MIGSEQNLSIEVIDYYRFGPGRFEATNPAYARAIHVRRVLSGFTPSDLSLTDRVDLSNPIDFFLSEPGPTSVAESLPALVYQPPWLWEEESPDWAQLAIDTILGSNKQYLAPDPSVIGQIATNPADIVNGLARPALVDIFA